MTEQHQAAEEPADDVDARFGELEAEIERLEAKRRAYDPDDIARGGAFVILNHDGSIRIECEFNHFHITRSRSRSKHWDGLG